MKKAIIVLASTFFVASQAADYLMVVNDGFKIKKFDVTKEISDWENVGVAYNCSNPTPLASDVYNGTLFDQTFDCSQEQKKYENVYHIDVKTGEKSLYTRNEIDSQIISVKDTKTNNDTGTYIASSCLDIKNHYGPTTDGYYNIKPSTNEISVFCDMQNGGYTSYKMTSATDLKSTEVEAKCSENNLQLFVPRTEAHLTKAVTTHTGEYFRLMGIYPKFAGARCDTVYLNSSTCTNWSPKDAGKWFVYNWNMAYPHNGGGVGVYPEPNGDNSLNASMVYSWDSAGRVTAFNDIRDDNPSYLGGYKTRAWTCSAKDENNI